MRQGATECLREVIMFCKKCGKEAKSSESFCGHCGNDLRTGGILETKYNDEPKSQWIKDLKNKWEGKSSDGRTSDRESRICISPACKAMIPIANQFCPICGSDQRGPIPLSGGTGARAAVPTPPIESAGKSYGNFDQLENAESSDHIFLRDLLSDDLNSKDREKSLKTIMDRKLDRVKQTFGYVINNIMIKDSKVYGPEANKTDFNYLMEGKNKAWSNTGYKCSIHKAYDNPLTVNAYAFYDLPRDRYDVVLFDGYVNLLLGVEVYFKFKQEEILADLSKQFSQMSCANVFDNIVLKYISKHDMEEHDAEKFIEDILKDSFLACYYVIAHEMGHVCLGHSRTQEYKLSPELSDTEKEQITRNRERQADHFAASLITAFIGNDDVSKLDIFKGYIKAGLGFAMKELVEQRDKPSTHPLHEERLSNAIRDNSEMAKKLYLDEEWLKDTLKIFKRSLSPL